MYAFRNSGLTKEQLTNMGVTGKDVPIAVQTPLFPPLITRPVEIDTKNAAINYKVMWKEDFRNHLFDVHSKSELNLTDDSYSSKISNALEKEHKKKLQFKLSWSQMPAELRPNNKRRALAKLAKSKRAKVVPEEVVEQKLKILEQKEAENPEAEVEGKSVKGDNETDEELENDEEDKMEDQDMDEGDYENNYFDNGEGYNDEDDNLDDGDGPVY